MAYVVKDRVKVTSTTTGTGTFTLGAAAVGFQSFDVINPTWNVTTAAYLQIFAVTNNPEGLFFKPDGLKMYIIGGTGGFREYDLSTAWNISTAVFLQSYSITQDTLPRSVFFKPDGLKMYIVGGTNNSVFEYDLSTAWSISTASYLQSFSVAAQDTGSKGLFFKPDGLKMYIVGDTNKSVYEYNLSSAWNISTASYLQSFSVNSQETSPVGLFFKPDGLKMYITGGSSDSVNEYNLSSAWNVTTASYLQRFSVASVETSPTGIFFNPNGGIMYFCGFVSDDVFQYLLGSNTTYYCITDGTNWEVGIGTYAGTDLSRTTVLESSNSNALVDFPAGIKDVFVTFPSENTLGTVPTADNSSVGTDLVAWLNLKKQLDAGVVNGVPYANNGTNGIVSTYSLVYTTASAYTGGVLAPNGDIHFIPYSANRGQKVSSNNTVSTYSLVYTAAGAYRGGVLTPNGDIHFVPSEAVRGQKVNSSGIVSTYSLVYTLSGAYWGGVLSPSGEVHFVPQSANRGQKISTAGVVSTYSLVYTASSAYEGGVLAPNGDIHFVPYNAAVGQKISAAGVVSTYSLVYTLSAAYRGGVLSPNGDIHFVPQAGVVGQKVSSSGVVSTYSLVYTAGSNYGGVLAPNGDIYFMLSGGGLVGQKVSTAGVVSTFSVLTDGSFSGGVLTANGDIHFIPLSSTRGQKISTNVQQKVGYALSPYFNKF